MSEDTEIRMPKEHEIASLMSTMISHVYDEDAVVVGWTAACDVLIDGQRELLTMDSGLPEWMCRAMIKASLIEFADMGVNQHEYRNDEDNDDDE